MSLFAEVRKKMKLFPYTRSNLKLHCPFDGNSWRDVADEDRIHDSATTYFIIIRGFRDREFLFFATFFAFWPHSRDSCYFLQLVRAVTVIVFTGC